jgi:DNA topoisomerase-1
MNLIIVESPTKAKTLSRFLGSDYGVEATMGHIKDLPKSKLGVDTENYFIADYVVVEKRDKEIKKLKSAAKKAKKIYLATDPDREGEAIAKHVEEVLCETKKLKNKKTKKPSVGVHRIVFHEITKSAVEHAISDPKEIDNNRVDAQIARRVLDRLVGYKLSPLLWKKVRRGLSAGRVQSVVVRLIVEKEREIEAFKSGEYWEIFVELQKSPAKQDPALQDKNQKLQDRLTVKLVKIDDKKAEIKDGKNAKKVVDDLEKSKYEVFDLRKKEVKKSPHSPFTTSTLTQTAARFSGWSAKKTMSVAQSLYEKGLITYHRTDSTNIASAAVSGVRDFIKEKYGDQYLPEKPRFYKTKSKSAQQAHEAIRPTNVKKGFVFRGTRFKKEGETLYSLIWKRFVACQMEAAVYDATAVDVVAEQKNQKSKKLKNKYLLRANGQIMKFDGWKVAFGGINNGNENHSGSVRSDSPGVEQLPDVVKGEDLDLIKVLSEQKFTQPPARYSEASLIKTLEKLGIGRPSTYAPTITTIQIRNYVEKMERRFHPTKVGIAVNDFLIGNFENVFDYGFTAQMEDDLDGVAKGEIEWQKMMGEFYKPFDKKLVNVEKKAKRVKIATEKLGKKCPDCKKGELVIRTGRFGKFISCSTFPDCKHTEKYVEKIGMKCPDCKKGDIIIKPTRKGRKFFGCSRYPKCKWASWKKPTMEEEK